MSETSLQIAALFAGLLLGAIFYGGLWWTVRRVVWSKSLGLWLIGSFALRVIVAVSGFYFVSQGDWRRLLCCLLGFAIARVAMTCGTKMLGRRKNCGERGVAL
jgi:F1F0 ATPase subunit 2